MNAAELLVAQLDEQTVCAVEPLVSDIRKPIMAGLELRLLGIRKITCPRLDPVNSTAGALRGDIRRILCAAVGKLPLKVFDLRR